MGLVYKILLRVLSAAALIVLTIYVVRAFDSRRMPDLAPEHRIHFDSEFSAAMEQDTDWAAYMAIDKAVAAELEQKIAKNE